MAVGWKKGRGVARAVLALALSTGAGEASAQVTRVSVSQAGVQGNNDSYGASWSPSGTQVVFYTEATNLFATPDPNIATYVAAKNLQTGAVLDLAVGQPTGLRGKSTYAGCTLCETHPQYNASGSELIFYAQQANGLSSADTSGLFNIYVKSMISGLSKLVSVSSTGALGNANAYFPSISGAATFAVFSSAASNLISGRHGTGYSLYMSNLNGGLSLVSTNAAGVAANGGSSMPEPSPDGTRLAFDSSASNFASVPAGSTNVFIKTLATGAITVASADANGVAANGLSTHAQWCSNGTLIAFQSNAKSLGGNGVTLQVYTKDLSTPGGAITLVSTTPGGVPGNGSSSHAVFSPDCTRIAMDTAATNFVAGSPAGSQQIAVKNLVTGAITVVSTTPAGLPATGNSNHAAWSPDGKYLAFASSASNLVAGDTNRRADVFMVPAP